MSLRATMTAQINGPAAYQDQPPRLRRADHRFFGASQSWPGCERSQSW
jgi:hypothetical protein